MGTIEVSLDEAASAEVPFAGVGGAARRLVVQSSHLESVVEPPPGARVLGASATDPCQAMAIGERCWTVQFHPEWDAAVTRGYVEQRVDVLRDEGIDPDALLDRVRDSGDGAAILSRFAASLD